MNKPMKSNHKQFKKNSKKLYSKFEKPKKRETAEEPENYMEKISSRLKLPSDILVGAPILTATGKNQLCLENYKGIIEYNGNLIKVQTKICKICIEGQNLNIDYFTNDEMKISGIIQAIYYKS